MKCKMKRIIFLFILFIGLLEFANAQSNKSIIISQSPIINQLIEKRTANNLRDQTTDGYRVQLFSGTNRGEAQIEKSKAEILFEDQTVHLIYNQPYFKVRVGDYRTKLEAIRMQELLKEHFENMFIVKDNISLPEIR